MPTETDIVELAAFARSTIASRPDLSELDRVPDDIWSGFVERGLFGLATAEAHGGSGLGIRKQIRVAECLSRYGRQLGCVSTWQSHICMGSYLLGGFGSSEQQRILQPSVADGTLTVAMAISEPDAGAHPKHLKTSAHRDGDEWVINGEKAYVTNGGIAGLIGVLAITDEEAGRKRYSVILVPSDSDGLEVGDEPKVRGLRPATHARLHLRDCRVPLGNLMGPPGGAYEAIAMPLRDHEDLANIGLMIGGIGGLADLVAETTTEADDKARAAVGRSDVALSGIRFLVDDAIEAKERGDTDRVRERLMFCRWQFRLLVDELAQYVEDCPLVRDLQTLSGVAGYVDLIRLRRVASRRIAEIAGGN